MQREMIERAKALLADGTVNRVIGWKAGEFDYDITPAVFTTAEELDVLPGIGPVLAGRIIAYREAHGPFTEAEQLLEVSGIGEAVLDGLRDQIVLEEAIG